MGAMHDLRLEQVPLDQIAQHPDNANNGDLDAIHESVEVNGFYQPIIVQRSTGYILAGNHRYQILYRLKEPTAPVIYLDVDDDAAKRIMVADNRTTRLGYDDESALASLLEDLYQTDLGLAGTGYDSQDLSTLLSELSAPLNADDFDPIDNDVDDSGKAAKHLRFSMMPVVSEDGKAYELTLTKSDLRAITAHDFNALRKALGQDPLTDNELATYDVPGWGKG